MISKLLAERRRLLLMSLRQHIQDAVEGRTMRTEGLHWLLRVNRV